MSHPPPRPEHGLTPPHHLTPPEPRSYSFTTLENQRTEERVGRGNATYSTLDGSLYDNIGRYFFVAFSKDF